MYYGLSLNVGNFGLDIYLTQFIFGVVELPARLGSLPLLQRLGRKIVQAAVLIFGGCACLALIAIPRGTIIKFLSRIFRSSPNTLLFEIEYQIQFDSSSKKH